MKIIEKYTPGRILLKEQTETISVVVTVYNIESYLERCLQSILHQTYRNLDVILVDDGSTDGSAALCDRYEWEDGRVRVIHQKNGGAYSARNTGLKCAAGTWLTFVDGDDWIDSGMYEAMLYALHEQKADLAACRYRKIFDDRTADFSTSMAAVMEGQEMLEKYLEEDEKWLIQTAVWNKLCKRSLLEGLSFPKSIYEDMMYTIQLLNRTQRSVYLDQAFYNYVCDRNTSTTNRGIQEKTFTDLIPNLYSRSAFLRQIGREDLALLHDYYLYKRLLLFYGKVARSQDPHKKEHEKWLRGKILEGKRKYRDIFRIPLANRNDAIRIRLFLISPSIFLAVTRLNDSFVIPVKTRIRNKRGKNA